MYFKNSPCLLSQCNDIIVLMIYEMCVLMVDLKKREKTKKKKKRTQPCSRNKPSTWRIHHVCNLNAIIVSVTLLYLAIYEMCVLMEKKRTQPCSINKPSTWRIHHVCNLNATIVSVTLLYLAIYEMCVL